MRTPFACHIILILTAACGGVASLQEDTEEGTFALSTPHSLLTTQVPALSTVTGRAGVNYELGTRLRSNVAGQITAVRFWKASGETGTHTGRIWSASRELLASVTFTDETDSGWQEQALPTPLSIAARTEYLVSVNTGNGFFVATNGGLATRIANGNLRSIVGSNGRYGRPGRYPTQSWQAANYFRDIVFAPEGSAPSPGPADGGTPSPEPADGGTPPPLDPGSTEHSVSLSWTASTTAGVSYRVYRGATCAGPYTAIASGLASTSFTDSDVQAGATYCYVTSAVNASNAESDFSNPSVVTIPSP